MKQMCILLLMILPICPAIAGPSVEVQKSPAAAPLAKAPETVIKEFYRWYIERLNRNKDPLTQEKTALRQYLTPEFLRKAPRLLQQTNADVFICAQDFDKDWGTNVQVSRLNIQGAVATANVALSGTTMNHKLKVRLKQSGGGWKLDRIDPLDG
jgi:hypothetical protein